MDPYLTIYNCFRSFGHLPILDSCFFDVNRRRRFMKCKNCEAELAYESIGVALMGISMTIDRMYIGRIHPNGKYKRMEVVEEEYWSPIDPYCSKLASFV